MVKEPLWPAFKDGGFYLVYRVSRHHECMASDLKSRVGKICHRQRHCFCFVGRHSGRFDVAVYLVKIFRRVGCAEVNPWHGS